MSTERKKEIPPAVVQVGLNIKAVIEKNNLKLRHVAHDSDLDVEVLRRYIAGKQIMGIDKAINIANGLKISISELFEGI